MEDNKEKFDRLLYEITELDNIVSKLAAIVVELRKRIHELTVQVTKFKEGEK